MDQFDVYFRRADLDGDGRISGAEAVGFFQASNLPKPVLAQIWTYADQARTGFLGRPEFYNALKLVTVAQSKRDLTQDIVKAALYGPAAAKIPAPQINLTALPQPTTNVPQMGGTVALAAPNATMGQPVFPSQSVRPPTPPQVTPLGTSPRPPQGTPNSYVSSGDWFGRNTNAGGISQTPNTNVLLTSLSHPSNASTPQDLLQTSSLPSTTKDSKVLATSSGNVSLTSDPAFGGDLFSGFNPGPSVSTTYSSSSAPASSALVPVSTGNPSITQKGDGPLTSLQSTYLTRPSSGPLQQVPTGVNPKQYTAAQTSSSYASSVGAGNTASNQSQLSWPKMKPSDVQKYTKVFVEVDTDRDGKITGEQARNLFLSWRLPREILKQVWDLSDQDNDSMLSLREFCIALYLMERYRGGQPLPAALPSNILDETLFSVSGQNTVSYGNTAWAPNPGLGQHQGMPGVRPVSHASSLRPPLPNSAPHAERSMQPNMQKSRGMMLDDPFAKNISTDEQRVREAAEVKGPEKVYLDSREKIEYYRTMMQELVLYKSRCDNRLNEITERASADKREAESLGKKYEEKYKQVGEISSKLSIEEARFRDIQERKMELQQAIVKMEQGGSADGILQVRADRIQSDLDELMKALTERCKKHGLKINSTALFELPTGWKTGIQEQAADWDEDWDKFKDEGFSFIKDVNQDGQNGVVSSKPQSTSVWTEKGSSDDSVTSDSFSNVDGRSEKPLHTGEHALETESAYAHSEYDLGSPAASPSEEYSDNHFRESADADVEIHGNFDESGWGTFDNNEDTDSVWGFNNINDSDAEKHGENMFFGSRDFGIDPIRTESPQSESGFQNKSPFTLADSVPSTPLSQFGNSPPSFSQGNHFFDSSSRFDSFSIPDSSEFSSRRESLTRFDSMNSTSDFGHSRFTSFDDADPFGSTGPFKVSSQGKDPKRDSGNWNAF